ncbi:amidoligase family protein [Clostridium oceanicum]|uniref:Amidoligase family protein n=1 Tax=Clostridium oceanicum TaxID=1543 RepID=A0ABN1JC73_9CLOT
MKNQAYGIEIELTGLSREKAAKVISKYWRKKAIYKGGVYDQYEVKDQSKRIWKIMRDGSIVPQKNLFGRIITAGDDYKVEVVSPICAYEDIESIQEMIRLLRKAGAIANKSCGIHVHIDGINHNEKSLRNLINIFYSKQDLIYKALEVDKRRERNYCKKVGERLVKRVNNKKPKDLEEMADRWYKPYCSPRNTHYHVSRYHGLNLHSTFTKGTVEFRFFNGTTHAGKIKAYIQFCLAVSNQSIIQKSASAKKTKTTNEKYTFRTWLLRLGLIGEEFKTCRTHLLANLEGNAAFRYRRVS